MNTHLDSIDRQIAAKHLLTHPFYLAWTRGELSVAALADYARQYYHHVAAFPTYLSAVHARCDDQPTRKQLLDNLIDEEAGSPNHPELWLQFAEGLGVSKEDVQSSEKWNETSNLIGTFRSVCSEGTTAEGLAALYAYESQIPAVSESKIKGLVENYQMTEPRDYQYFTRPHRSRSRTRRRRTRDARRSTSPTITPRPTANAVDRILDALWEMLSGVCRRHAIACA